MYAPEPFDMDLNLFLIQKKEIMLHQEEEDDPNDQNDQNDSEQEQILLIHELYARPRHIRDFITLTSIVAMEDSQRNRFLRSMIDTYYCTATTAAAGAGGGATLSSSTFEILILMHQQNKNQHLCTSTTLIQKMICNDDIF